MGALDPAAFMRRHAMTVGRHTRVPCELVRSG
jgi:hypothetical protein